MNTDTYLICSKQGEIFELVSRQGIDMQAFTEQYLCSDFCRRQFDTAYSRYQCADAGESLDIYGREKLSHLPRYEDNKMFLPETAWWIGFTYRQLWYRTGIASRELVQRVPFRTLAAMYPGYHTIDEDMAADRIIEAFRLSVPSPKPAPENR